MIKKVVKAVGKLGLMALNRVSCRSYKELYPRFLRWGGFTLKRISRLGVTIHG